MASSSRRHQPGRAGLTAEIAFLTRALKAPTLRESAARLAERARAEAWTHEEFLVACLQREVAAREAHGGEGRIRAARFPAPQELGGVRLRPRPRPETRPDRAPGHPRLRHRQARTWCSSARPAPARPISRPDWRSAPAKPGTGCCSPPPPNGSTGSPPPTTPAGCKPSWSGSAATR